MALHEDLTRVIEGARDHSRKNFNVVKESYGQYLARAILASDVIAQVRAETVEYVAQIATDTLRMCQAGGVGEKNILPLQQEVGFQLCIDNIANLAKSMKGEGQ